MANNNITDINATTAEQVKEIRKSFRLLMNGVTSQSMREKGMDYHINWGASLQHLKEMAAEYKQDKALALELWKDNVRECKIIATLLMPHDQFDESLAMEWIEQTHTQEIAEVATMNLYQYMPYAEGLAMRLIESEEPIRKIHGYNILSKLFSKGAFDIDDDKTEDFLKCAVHDLQSEKIALKHSAWNAVTRFADIDEACLEKARIGLKSIKMDDWL